MLWLLSKSEHKYHNHCPYKITARWGCRTLKSFVRPKFSENALSHLLHWHNFSTVCLCISIIEVVFHSKGRITLAILIWSFPSVCSKMNDDVQKNKDFFFGLSNFGKDSCLCQNWVKKAPIWTPIFLDLFLFSSICFEEQRLLLVFQILSKVAGFSKECLNLNTSCLSNLCKGSRL